MDCTLKITLVVLCLVQLAYCFAGFKTSGFHIFAVQWCKVPEGQWQEKNNVAVEMENDLVFFKIGKQQVTVCYGLMIRKVNCNCFVNWVEKSSGKCTLVCWLKRFSWNNLLLSTVGNMVSIHWPCSPHQPQITIYICMHTFKLPGTVDLDFCRFPLECCLSTNKLQ